MILLPLLFALALADPLLEQTSFPGTPEQAGWHITAQRPEIAPRGWIDRTVGRGGQGSLALSGGGNAAEYGGWERTLGAITPGAWYRLTAEYRCAGFDNERRHVLARLDWRTAGGQRAGQPDYGTFVSRGGVPQAGLAREGANGDGEWRQIVLDAPAPAGATQVKLQLLLSNAAQGMVWWDHIRLEPIPAPAPRMVHVVSVNLRPRDTKSAQDSVARFIEFVRGRVQRADLLVLPEGVTEVGNGKTYMEVAEPVPGPTTAVLGALARDLHTYLVAGVVELEGPAAYNTAVLIDREGRLIGKYRKVYLPREEIEGGLTPGDSYPVFDTDFGRLGLMICWDSEYADPARALALGGAEILALPIWGGDATLVHARAIENHVFLVSSGHDYATEIVDPEGKVVARAEAMPGIATADIDLNRRYVEEWLGHMRDRLFHELRDDVPVTRR
ncbi:MAG: carbon-nitrogen hydrolase family protein [Bryobacteraceae bacterium]